MTRAEFIQTAVSCGYASQKTAERYAGERDEFSDDDLIEVYHAANWLGNIKSEKWRVYDGTKSTKHLKDEDGE